MSVTERSSTIDEACRLLGVSPHAKPDEIRAAYRAAAKRCHPDLFAGDAEKEKQFKELTAAYATLVDPDRTAPRPGSARPGPARPGHHPGGARPPGARHGAPRPAPKQKDGKRRGFLAIDGANAAYDVEVPIASVPAGCSKTITTTDGRALKVTVPAGIADGQVLRLRGQGLPGKFGGAAGDALISVTIVNDGRFRRDGLDVHADMNVTLGEAVLGGTATLVTPAGRVNVSVPSGSNTGATLRLRGKGLRDVSGTEGDLLVRLLVTLPKQHDAALRQFVEHWAAAHPYDVRGG